MRKALAISHREGITHKDIFEMFPDEVTAARWFENVRWPSDSDRNCPGCGSLNAMRKEIRGPLPFRCRDCRQFFSVRQGSAMESSRIPLRKWEIAIYLNATSPTGGSSMKLHRNLKITQRSDWFMAQRQREAFVSERGLFDDPVQVDNTYKGGKRGDKLNAKGNEAGGRGPVQLTAVVGVKDHENGKATKKMVRTTDRSTLQDFVADPVDANTKAHADGAHSDFEYARGMAHISGIESFWAMPKRGHQGIFHPMSPQHLHHYANEFAGRHDVRNRDTMGQMQDIVAGPIDERLVHRDLSGGR